MSGEDQGAAPTGPKPSQVEPPSGVSPANAASVSSARPLSEWTEEDGCVLWWKFPVEEAPYSGSPNDVGRTCVITLNLVGEEHVNSVNIGGWPGYHTHWTPFVVPLAPGGDARRAEAGTGSVEDEHPIDEVEAPASQDLKALQAENERLKEEAAGWRSLWFEANRKTSAWAYQCCKDKIALAESERKRVEAESRGAVLSSALTMLGHAVTDPVVQRAINDVLARVTPTQQPPHAP